MNQTSIFPRQLYPATNKPVVHLVNAFTNPYDNAVATARTCYSDHIVSSSEVRDDPKGTVKRDRIARSIFLAGHHTTLQHASFQFTIEGVSRNSIWSFLHSHPHYNSEQVSQRFVPVTMERFTVPSLAEPALSIYQNAVGMLMKSYTAMQFLLMPMVQSEYQRRFPARQMEADRWKNDVTKKVQEVARYVLPLATHAHLYHTISGITLFRYYRLCNLFDVPQEQKQLVQSMVDEVNEWDPDFLKNAEDPMAIEDTPEYQYIQRLQSHPTDPGKFTDEFDRSLDGYTSRLTDYSVNAEENIAEAVRGIFGLCRTDLAADQAVSMVLDPRLNPYLTETLNLNHHSKLTRSLNHAHFTFHKKLSHTADSQEQRHRTLPGSRPILSRHLSLKPDYVIPMLIAKIPAALSFYQHTMEKLWHYIAALKNISVPDEAITYLLPNAFPVRYLESGSLLDFHHKWTHRLCYTAQEEIWKSSVEEVLQVKSRFPVIGRYLSAPCTLRLRAAKGPLCPEGSRYCGVPVWRYKINEYSRTI